MKFRTIITIFCLMTAVGCMAQRRQLQEARLILKGDKGYEQAEQLMKKLLNDTTHLEYRDNPRIYDMWLQSVEKQYAQLNEKMYKKQQVDTTMLFDLTHRLFTIGECLDSIDMRPDKKGRVSLQYRKDNAARLVTYRPNLFYGGAYYLRKDNPGKAFDFFEMYIDCAHPPNHPFNVQHTVGEAFANQFFRDILVVFLENRVFLWIDEFQRVESDRRLLADNPIEFLFADFHGELHEVRS